MRAWQLTMVLSGVFFFIGAALLAAAIDMTMLVIGRCILGLGVGVGTTVGPVYLSEIAPPKLRGTLNVIFQLLITIGILCAGSGFSVGWNSIFFRNLSEHICIPKCLHPHCVLYMMPMQMVTMHV